MPQVPKYGPPKVDATPLPGARLEARDNHAGDLAWSQALDEVGSATQRLAVHFKEKAVKEQFESFQTETLRSFDQIHALRLLSEDPGEKGTKGLLNQRGKAVNEHLNGMLEEADLEASEVLKGARTDEQRQWGAATWQQRRSNMQQLGLRHGSDQMRVYLTEQNTAAQQSTIARGVMAAPFGVLGRQEIEVATHDLAALIAAQSARDGDSDEETDRKVALGRAELYSKATIEMLLKRKVPEALAFWKEVSPYVTDDGMRQRVMQATESASTDYKAVQGAQEAWAKFKPADDGGEPDDDAIHAHINTALKDDPQALRAALALVDDSISSWRRARNGRQDQFMSPLLDRIAGGASVTEVLSSPEYNRLQGERKLAVFDRVTQAASQRQAAAEHVIDRNFNLAEREKDRAWQDRQRAQAIAADNNNRNYATLTDPNALRAMPATTTARNEFYTRALEQLPGSPDQIKLAMQAWDAAHPELKPDLTPAAINVSDEQLRATFGEMGYPWAKSGTRNSWRPEHQALFGRVASAAAIEIDKKQRANNNKPLEEAEKKEIIRTILDTRVQVQGQWFTNNYTNKTALDVNVTDRTGEMKRERLPLTDSNKQKYPKLYRQTLDALREFGMKRTTGRGTTFTAPIQGLDETLEREFKDRIEWAMALSLSGASDADIREVIRIGALPEAK